MHIKNIPIFLSVENLLDCDKPIQVNKPITRMVGKKDDSLQALHFFIFIFTFTHHVLHLIQHLNIGKKKTSIRRYCPPHRGGGAAWRNDRV